MLATILGIENVSYTSKKTGQPAKGLKIYFAYPVPNDRGSGMRSEDAFISQNVEFHAQVGDKVNIHYNRFGSVEEVEVVENSK